MLRQLKIDPEFQSKIPPLRQEEMEQLEENILADGVVINPLIVWDDVIVDGHNRYRIIQQHPEINFTIYEKNFADRYAAIAWICKNQLGRRNLTPQQFKYLVGQRYEAEKQTHGGERKNAGKSTDKICPLTSSHQTRAAIAQEVNVSEGFVQNAANYAKGVDAAEETEPGIKQEILTGSIKPTEKTVAAIAKAPPEERPALVQQLRQAKPAPNPQAPHTLEKAPPAKSSPSTTLQSIRDISANMVQSNGELDADDICSELEDALDTMIFRWDNCLKTGKRWCKDCNSGIHQLTEKGIQYLQKIRRKAT